MSTIAAIGPTPRNKLLPAKGDTTIPTAAAADVDLGFVDEFHDRSNLLLNRKKVGEINWDKR
jgi:hypothetical protein